MIKIAYIVTPITFGGSEKVSLNFLRFVNRNRFDIKPILLIRPWEDPPYFAREIIRLGYSFETVPVALKNDGDPLRIFRAAYRLFLILKKGSFEIVHTHGYFADILGLPIASLLGIGRISTCHGFIVNNLKLRLYNWLDIYALRLCNSVIAVSHTIKQDLTMRGIKPFRIGVLPNAVSTISNENQIIAQRHEKRSSLGLCPSDIVVGFLGRLSKEKGLWYLIRAIVELSNVPFSLKVLIVGDGPERKLLEKEVKAQGLENSVIFVGFQEDGLKWLPAFDIFVLPSLTEGTPLALLEAMATGLPAIATAVGDVPKIIVDGVNGFLAPPADFKVISTLINLLAISPDLKCQLGRAGESTIRENYSMDRWCRATEEYYCKTLLSG